MNDTPTVLADRIADLEERIEDLRADIDRCRKSMTLAKVAILGGFLGMAAAAAGVAGSGPTIFLFGIAASLGGLVGFGATRSTMLETRAKLRSLDDMRSMLTDEVPMRIVEPLGVVRPHDDGATATVDGKAPTKGARSGSPRHIP